MAFISLIFASSANFFSSASVRTSEAAGRCPLWNRQQFVDLGEREAALLCLPDEMHPPRRVLRVEAIAVVAF